MAQSGSIAAHRRQRAASRRWSSGAGLLFGGLMLLACTVRPPASTPATSNAVPSPALQSTQLTAPSVAPTPSDLPTAAGAAEPLGQVPGDLRTALTRPVLSIDEVSIYDRVELAFNVLGSPATRPDFPYDPKPPPGLQGRVGITVEGLFLPPGESDWGRAIVQPAFRYQAYETYIDDSGVEALYPVGEPDWRVRFAPTAPGRWQVRLRLQDASVCAIGVAPCTTWVESESLAFTAGPQRDGQHGFVRVSDSDPRYFEYSDGTPFVVAGFQAGLGADTRVDESFARFSAGGVTVVRSWLSATGVFSRGLDQWAAWTNAELDWDQAAPGEDVSARLSAEATSPCIFQGFGEAPRPVFFGARAYDITIHARLVDVTSPRDPAQPFGLAAHLGFWPMEQCAGFDASGRYLTPHWSGDGDWATYTASFTLPEDVVLDGSVFLTLALENAASGAAYIDSVHISDRVDGPNHLAHGNLNTHLSFDPAAAWRWDVILERAAAHSLTLKLVVLEKQDPLLGLIRADGSIADERDDANFYGWPGQETKVRRLQAYFWRYLTARWGYSTAVHSWELLNEGDPFNGNHYDLANAFARAVHTADPNRHLVTTSFWHSFPVAEFWGLPQYAELDYADFHAYVDTSFLQPGDFSDPDLVRRCGDERDCYLALMRDDSAFFHLAHSAAAADAGLSIPVMRGESGLTQPGSEQELDPALARDVNGVWLHKQLFAQLAPGALHELFWFSDLIEQNDLYPLFGRYQAFIADVRLNAGSWRGAQVEPSDSALRVVGQVQMEAGRAVLWIDHAAHTWKAVVNGASQQPITATLVIHDLPAGARLPVAWWDLCSGQPPTCQVGVAREEMKTVDAQGRLTLTVTDLVSDIGVRIGTFDNESAR